MLRARSRTWWLSLLFAGVTTVNAAVADSHPFSVQDLVAMDRIVGSQLSPDGRRIAYVVSRLDLDNNRRLNDLYLVGSDGSAARQLTVGNGTDSDPRWAPDNRTIYFLSARSGSSQVWRIRIDGGEAEPVTALPLDVNTFLLSPDGSTLLLAIDVFPDCTALACTRSRLDELAARQSTGQIYDQLFIRHWDSWEDGRRSHLVALPVAGGDAIDLMQGMAADAPSQPFGGTEELTFTPDGAGIVFSARDAGLEEAWSTNFDLYFVPLDGSAAPRNLTAANPAWDTQPTFSPDGKTLAYLAMSRPGFEADRFRILLRPWPSAEDAADRELAPEWDRSPTGIAWSGNGKWVLATADNLGQASLFAIDAKRGQVRTLVERGSVSNLLPHGNEVYFTLDSLTAPADLYSIGLDGKGMTALTHINRERLAEVRQGEPEQFTFAGWNGETVHAYLVKPVDFDPGQRYPLAFLIHGGPQGSFGNHFHYRWNPQTYAGAGYAAVMVDFHGSTGYGQGFTDSIRDDWGGKPLVDLQKGLAAALERYPWVDSERICALGASYGGYMINWIAGVWQEPFRCLVNHDGSLDERMSYLDTEELWFPEWEHEGTPWSNPESYEKHNPIRYVGDWHTPMLVIHGARDFRVPETQGIATFNALQRLGIPSRLLYFPDENHWVLKPANSILWHETVLGWLDRWTGP